MSKQRIIRLAVSLGSGIWVAAIIVLPLEPSIKVAMFVVPIVVGLVYTAPIFWDRQ